MEPMQPNISQSILRALLSGQPVSGRLTQVRSKRGSVGEAPPSPRTKKPAGAGQLPKGGAGGALGGLGALLPQISAGLGGMGQNSPLPPEMGKMPGGGAPMNTGWSGHGFPGGVLAPPVQMQPPLGPPPLAGQAGPAGDPFAPLPQRQPLY